MSTINPSLVSLQLLGQSGCRIEYNGTVIYMDPYLSNSVQELDSPDLQRLIVAPLPPENVTDAGWVLITHDHIDHCDPHTLPEIARVSESCYFIGPPPVLKKLLEWGISDQRCQSAQESWMQISQEIKIRAVPAAHPVIKRDEERNLLTIGYIMEIEGKRIYLAGDTSVTQELIDTLTLLRPITTAILPVNERNFFRDRRGIIGNMSVRESFLLADEIGVKTVIPVHWDMFEANSVGLDEIHAVYQQMEPAFDLQVQPDSIVL
jgi:L-ascorbate metabolism protein UlaG (beta-lactamase superfamily)